MPGSADAESCFLLYPEGWEAVVAHLQICVKGSRGNKLAEGVKVETADIGFVSDKRLYHWGAGKKGRSEPTIAQRADKHEDGKG